MQNLSVPLYLEWLSLFRSPPLMIFFLLFTSLCFYLVFL